MAGHRRSFAGHRLRSANPLPAVGDGPGHGSQEREDDARVLRRAAPTARDGAVPPPRIDGSRGRTARSPRISAAAASVLRPRLDPAAARGRPARPPGGAAPAPSSARALGRGPISSQAPARGGVPSSEHRLTPVARNGAEPREEEALRQRRVRAQPPDS